MQKKRLLKLAELLDKVPKKNFDMRRFRYENECGTVCCAAGHAMLDPWFIKRGLHQGTQISVPQYGNFYANESLMEFFGISWLQVCYLFAPGKVGATPKTVAKNIRKFVESGGEVPGGTKGG